MTTDESAKREGAELPPLLPCPFCGGPVALERARSTRDPIYGERKWWGVTCRNTINRGGTCAIEAIPTASPEAAIARWNRRDNSALEASNKALRLYEEAFDEMFSHCLSNGVFNWWGAALDCTKLNEAHLAATRALAPSLVDGKEKS